MEAQPFPIAGKTALVTGGARRIGRAVCLALAGEGARLVVHYGTSGDEAEALAASLREDGGQASTVQADLSDPAQAQGLFARAVELAGPIDILVNNAAIFPPSRLPDFSAQELGRNVQINAMAPLQLGRALAAQGRQGAIVNFLDTRITSYDARHAAYHLSKRMLFTLTRMMALEFAPAVRVNAVAPGVILPPPGQDESYLEGMAETNPLRRIGSPELIADAVLFLLRSGFVTGQVLYVDGGRHMRGMTYG
ncbi:MAG: SDR family oxidoreductase [Candidatus Brocadiia bacterium]